MLRNYLKTALRSMRRHLAYTSINILGLSVGLLASFLILLWVQDELHHDQFHTDVDQIYRVMRTSRYGDGQVYTFASVTKKLDEVLDEEFPEITMGALQGWPENMTFSKDGVVFRESGRHGGKDYFKMFSYTFLAGNPETALDAPNAVVLTESMARKYFGDVFARSGSAKQAAQQIIGESLQLDNRMDVFVSGVIENPPAQSSIKFDFMLPVEELEQRNEWMDSWGNNGIWMFVKLAPGADAGSVSNKIRYLVRERSDDTVSELFLQPYGDMYLRSRFDNGQLVGGRIDYVRIFGFVGIFILLLASINFMNLATARSAQRSLEVGIRKTFGSTRKSLTSQFLGESILLAFFSLLIALIAVWLLLPGFNTLTQKQISLFQIDPIIWLQFGGIALATGILSGMYPAIYLSSIKLMDVLRKGNAKTARGQSLRRSLVVFQFAVSIILIAGSITVYEQMQYIRSKNLGLDRENVLFSTLEGPLAENFDVFKNTLLRDNSIENVTRSSQNPLQVGTSTPAPRWDGKDPEDKTLFYIISAGNDFFETMGMEMADGRAFSKDFGLDSMNVVVNETAARAMGMQAPVGQPFSLWDIDGQIVGVVKDFHMNSMYNPIEPLIIRYDPEATNKIFIRTRAGQTEQAIAAFETVFSDFNTSFPFEYEFLDTAYEQMYRSEVVIGRLTNYFTVLALFIACLGLFGLASYTTERRTREIAIRKVLGANMNQVVLLLSREFLIMISIALVIGIPIAYLLLNEWLTGFEYHVPMGAGVFVTAALTLFLVTSSTIGYQSIKAALINPARAMRME